MGSTERITLAEDLSRADSDIGQTRVDGRKIPGMLDHDRTAITIQTWINEADFTGFGGPDRHLTLRFDGPAFSGRTRFSFTKKTDHSSCGRPREIRRDAGLERIHSLPT